ncbi:hypothetical protein V6N12_049849 [Hibiscus sabdariffa]|uniref:RNase H type-1 domain-containing protein n=1 Tax=Hibiscus sabdariffa TaxID=183260 RepID=A0ABR2GBU4_9ROSI
MVLHSMVLEGDARTVITKLATSISDCFVISLIIATAKALQGNFACCRFCHTARSANQASHTLAREGVESTQDNYWVKEVPPSVMVLAATDRRSLYPP